MINRDVLADARRLIAAGADRETVLLFLRARGLNKIDSINSTRVLYNMPMPDAKILVDHSEAWIDRYESDRELRDAAKKAMRELAAANDVDLPELKFLEAEEPEEPGS